MDLTAILSAVLVAIASVTATALTTYLINKPKEAKRKKAEQDAQLQEIAARQADIIQQLEVIKSTIEKHREDINTEKLGLQAILRDRIYQLNRYCKGKGWANMEEKQNFENMYQQYHKLGANGVMDVIHEQFLELPESEPNQENK